MGTEVWLFILTGAVAVVAAVMLLLSQNAVHSALFLIINMGCIAFLFLLLDAPFLAMVQIAVYAGAIMVLFLFVIMLLGTDKPGGKTPFGWLAPGAIVLALIFLVTVGVALSQGGISDLQAPAAHPQLRVAHFAADAGELELRIDGATIASGLANGALQEYETLPPGEYELELLTVNGLLLRQTVVLEAGQRITVLVQGTGTPTLSLVSDVAGPGSLRVFNAWNTPVSLVDYASELSDEDTLVLAGDIGRGELSPPLAVAADADFSTWALVRAVDGELLARMTTDAAFSPADGDSALLVVSPVRRFEGSLEASMSLLMTPGMVTFGSPSDVGLKLFNQYLLPMQIVAILLLVAMVGAIVLTHRPKVAPELERARLGRRRVSRPLTSVIASQLGQPDSARDGETAALPPAGSQER